MRCGRWGLALGVQWIACVAAVLHIKYGKRKLWRVAVDLDALDSSSENQLHPVTRHACHPSPETREARVHAGSV